MGVQLSLREFPSGWTEEETLDCYLKLSVFDISAKFSFVKIPKSTVGSTVVAMNLCSS